MKKIFVLAIPGTLLLAGFDGYGQSKIGKDDSVIFANTWIRFANAIINKDTGFIKQQSLSSVSCLNCQDSEMDQNFCVPITAFIRDAFQWGEKAWFKASASTGNFHIQKGSFENSMPCGNKRMEKNAIYEAGFVTLRPDELEAGHEGAGAVYRFIKYKGRFLFFEMFTVP